MGGDTWLYSCRPGCDFPYTDGMVSDTDRSEERRVIQISSLFVSAFYPVMDYNERGYQFLLRAGSRGSWWKSKLVWVVFSTIIFFMLLAGAFFCTELVVSAIGVSGGGSDLWRCIGTFSMLKKVQCQWHVP